MHLFIFIIEMLLLVIGALFLIRSLTPIKYLILELPEGKLTKRWKILSFLIMSFLLGYLIIGYDLWEKREATSFIAIVISIVFLIGGLFAFFVGQLALNTTNDVKNLALLQHESITDALTGLNNRRYFDQRLGEEVALSKRYKHPLTLMLLDIDYFKKVNDTYGHKVGDEVLQNLSRIILETVRDSDIVARYGGEEIVIITPNTSKQEAQILGERIRSLVEQTTVAVVGTSKEIVQVTVSIGICSLSLVIADKDALIEETDQALYAAKKYGRNRVVLSNW